jgi:RecA-family ATPase
MGANNPTASKMTMVSDVGLGAIDIGKAFHDAPPKLDFIWPGFLAGTVGGLFSPGGVGKSYWTLESAMSIACSLAGGDLVGLSPARTGRVVYLAGEDPVPILTQRIHAIGQHLNPSARSEISQNLLLVPVWGKRLNIMYELHLSWLIEYCANARLIVIDTLSRIHQLDENSNSDMAHLIATLEHVAAITGASVLYLHHVSKGSVRDGQAGQQQAARGASALVDNARWAGFVAKMTEDEGRRLSDRPNDRQPIGNDRRGFFIRFGVSKQNYDATFMERWYERQEGGVLVPVELMEARNGSGKKREKRDEL